MLRDNERPYLSAHLCLLIISLRIENEVSWFLSATFCTIWPGWPGPTAHALGQWGRLGKTLFTHNEKISHTWNFLFGPFYTSIFTWADTQGLLSLIVLGGGGQICPRFFIIKNRSTFDRRYHSLTPFSTSFLSVIFSSSPLIQLSWI